MAKRTAHYVLSTHWDREWYQHFQDFRYRLVQLLDRVLEGWRTKELLGPFQTDGQAVLVEDYLEIRPERRAEVEGWVRDAKLVVGPWYVLPDEFLVSGETLVRNLQLGRRLAREWGGQPSNAGFLCDMFGHNSQMPQILAGFGMHAAFVWRGTNLVDQRLFNWRGADGTTLLAYRFGPEGYCDYAVKVRGGNRKDSPFDVQQARMDLQSFLEQEGRATPAQTLLLFDGGDHMGWDAEAYAVLQERIVQSDRDFRIIHSSLDDYLADLLAEMPQIETVSEGELREPARHPVSIDHTWLVPGTLASRVWIKQSNARCQSLLCQWAEPFSAMASRWLEREYPQGFLDAAWKALLHNHPHDSICGCSIDAVHEDMKYRFAQSSVLAERLAREAQMSLAASVQGDVAEDELRVAVFNPTPVPLQQPLDLLLDIPTGWPVYHAMEPFEPRPAFRIFGPDGAELPYQFLGQIPNRKRFRTYPTGFPKGYRVDEVRVALSTSIPALGYTALTVRRGEAGLPTRHPELPGLATSGRSLEDEFLALSVEADGSLTVLDKRSGQTYARCLTFEDCADIGDGWNFGSASNDQHFSSAASPASVALVSNGPLLGSLRIRNVMELPAAFDFPSNTRQAQFERLVVDSTVTLRAGAQHIEVETTVHNTVRDHRLRVLFPSGATGAQTYLADSPFDVVERPIALRADNHLYREPEIETKPQQSWTAVFNDRRGLAVLADGLLESSIMDTPQRILALTLLRATRRTVFTDGEPGGQLQGELRFRYWLVPLAGAPDRAGLCRLGQLLAAGWRTAQVTPADQFLHGTQHTLPLDGSLLEVRGEVVLSSLRQVGEVLEARLWNPNPRPVRFTLRFAAGFSKAQPVDFEGNALGEVAEVQEGQMELELAAKKISTWQLT